MALVYLNAGHGIGKTGQADPGAVGPTGLREADVTAQVARRCASYLAPAGIPVTGDWRERRSYLQAARAVRDAGATLLISIHCNSATSRAAKGIETWIRHQRSRALAIAVQHALLKACRDGSDPYPVTDRGIKVESFGILNVSCPAVLIELLFINNPVEENLLRQAVWQDRFGYVLAETIKRYLKDTSALQ
jgi:N-acetylmuramoyl-L-alanine amidase